MNFQTEIKYLKGVGEKRAKLLEKLGVRTFGALLRLYPRAYEDWSQIFPINEAPYDRPSCVKASVLEPVSEHKVRPGMII